MRCRGKNGACPAINFISIKLTDVAETRLMGQGCRESGGERGMENMEGEWGGKRRREKGREHRKEKGKGGGRRGPVMNAWEGERGCIHYTVL